jgi:hypothetical protein
MPGSARPEIECALRQQTEEKGLVNLIMPRLGQIVVAKTALVAAILAGSILVSPIGAQSDNSTAAPAAPAHNSRYQPNHFSKRAELHYSMVWGVDSLSVKSVESGEMIRFTYRVVDADKAKVLNDKKFEPSLVDPTAGVKLVVPQMEKIGQLRQSATPEPGKAYWMAFSNKGRRVKRGDRVSVVIGQFRADGLVVE